MSDGNSPDAYPGEDSPVSPGGIDIISADFYFVSAMRHQLDSTPGISYRVFDRFEDSRAALKGSEPRVLIIEWNMRDMEAVDFLIRVSEDLSWGNMTIYFVCDHELTESEQFQMISLGTSQAFYKGLGSDELPGFIGLVDAVHEEFSTRDKGIPGNRPTDTDGEPKKIRSVPLPPQQR